MKELSRSLRLTIVLIVLFGLAYPLFIWGVSRISPNAADGNPIMKNGKLLGYESIGMKFTDDKYFWGRPSAADNNAASSSASNLSPSNPAFTDAVKTRIDTFLVHDPGVKASDIPADLVTASGSGLDPDISPEAARIQIARVARARGIAETRLQSLVDTHVDKPILGFWGVERVNVVKLNLALDELK